MLRKLTLCLVTLALLVFADSAGSYTGTWTPDSSGGNGKLTLAIGATELTQASFTYQGQDVKAKPISLNADGDQLDFTFEYDLGGTLLRSRMQGTVTGKTIKGKYKSTTAADGSSVDEGTWEVTQQ